MTGARDSSEMERDRLWSTEETARFLGLRVSTLYQLTYKGTGPRCYRVGKYRRYKPSEVLLWLNGNLVEHLALET
jgi:predicted DNA-binding transcriptional regulator AlpA